MESIGERIRRIRRSNNMTQQEVVDRMGVSLTVLARIENGVTRALREDTAERIGKALGVSAEYILYGNDIRYLYPADVLNFLTSPENVGTVKKFVYMQLAENAE